MKTLLKSALSLLAGLGLMIAGPTIAYSEVFPANLAGSYQAQLIVAPNYGSPVGSVSLTVRGDGGTTGTVVLPNRKSYGFKTTLDGDNGDGFKANVIVVKGPRPIGPQPLQFTSLRIESDGTITAGLLSTMTGVSGIFSAANTLKFATFTASNPPDWVGAYTMAMLPAQGSTETTPVGAGYATLAVANNGAMTAKVTLGDGTKATIKANPTASGAYRIYNPVYTTGGYFSSLVDLQNLSHQADAVWNKPANAKDKKYKDGFNATLSVKVAEWLKLSSIKIPAGFTSSKNFAVDFSGEGIVESDFTTSLPDTARFTGNGSIQAVAGGAGAPAENDSKEWNKRWVAVKVNPVTGEFTGSQKLASTGKTIPVAGVILPSESITSAPFAYGQYRVTPAGGTEISGLLTFSGPLEDNPLIEASGTYKIKVTEGDDHKPNPNKVPSNGEVITVTIPEDFSYILIKTSKADPRKVPLQGSGSGFITTRVYTDAIKSPFNYVFASLTFGADGKLGIVSLTYTAGLGSQVASYAATDDGNDGIIVKQ